MGTAKSVMVVVTHPTHPLTEDAYNEWYSDNHIPYVLFSEDFPSASRFKQTKVLKGMMTPYIAFYQTDWEDTWQAQQAYADVGKKGIGEKWNRSPGDSLQVEWWAYYQKIAETGAPSPDIEPPNAVLVTFAHPDGGLGNTGIFLAEAVETWYQHFLDDMNDCPLARGSTLYRLGLRAGGPTPPRYMTIHELDTDKSASVDQIHAKLMDWMRGTKLRADPEMVTKPNAPVGLDFWGYYERIITHPKASEEDLLKARGD
ncbi:MAG: hypothetical protein QF515_15130 [Pseudomonadales bacterium]|jgi:hypothetical protein|nr:hypothetical protein [Pseudomonadales bacterium]|tara:strand:+ start:362 stop:1132 length:771 start_codon:yes stop_codon:yes gene_type:complete